MKRRIRLFSPLLILGVLTGIRWINQSRDKTRQSVKPAQRKLSQESDSREVDELTEIEGIGPKSAGVLHEAGIHTYARLAEHTPEQLKEILKEADMRTLNPDTWPEQAKLAAKGKWDELYALRDELKGGRRV